MRKKLLCLMLLATACACRAEPPTAESVDSLLVLTKSEAVIDAVAATLEQNMRQAMAQTVAGKRISAEQQHFLDDAPRQFAAVMKEEMSWATLKPLYVQLYRETFTQEEVDGLIAFYRSPAGEALAHKMPLVMQKTTAIVQSRLQPLLETMKAVTAKALNDAQRTR